MLWTLYDFDEYFEVFSRSFLCLTHAFSMQFVTATKQWLILYQTQMKRKQFPNVSVYWILLWSPSRHDKIEWKNNDFFFNTTAKVQSRKHSQIRIIRKQMKKVWHVNPFSKPVSMHSNQMQLTGCTSINMHINYTFICCVRFFFLSFSFVSILHLQVHPKWHLCMRWPLRQLLRL